MQGIPNVNALKRPFNLNYNAATWVLVRYDHRQQVYFDNLNNLKVLEYLEYYEEIKYNVLICKAGRVRYNALNCNVV
jgi:hypothetical protein